MAAEVVAPVDVAAQDARGGMLPRSWPRGIRGGRCCPRGNGGGRGVAGAVTKSVDAYPSYTFMGSVNYNQRKITEVWHNFEGAEVEVVSGMQYILVFA